MKIKRVFEMLDNIGYKVEKSITDLKKNLGDKFRDIVGLTSIDYDIVNSGDRVTLIIDSEYNGFDVQAIVILKYIEYNEDSEGLSKVDVKIKCYQGDELEDVEYNDILLKRITPRYLKRKSTLLIRKIEKRRV